MSQGKISSASPQPIELYSMATPNGIKVAACLEELSCLMGEGFTYVPYPVNLRKAENRTEAFHQISPAGKIPAIVDPSGPNGARVMLFESGAILLYLAEKYNALITTDPTKRAEMLSWLFWGSAAVSNQLKQFGFYSKYCPHSIPYCVARYEKEVTRLLLVLNQHLSDGRPFIIGGNKMQ
jgi:GST-like protein